MVAATVVAAVAAATLVGCDVTLSTNTSPAITTCAVRYLSHDATAIFSGPNGASMCTAMKKGDGNWYDLPDASGTPGGTLICSGTMSTGVTWKVYDTGGHIYGDQACASINQYSANR